MAAVKVTDGVWNLIEDMVNCFLVVGSEKALVIDTGFGKVKLLPEIAEITDKPVTLVCTHGHGDHTGGVGEFESFYISAKDIPIMQGDTSLAKALEPGQKFDLGDRILEVIETPGHTPGSISLLDREARLLFAGDMLSERPIYLIPGMGDIKEYMASLEKYKELDDAYDFIVCSHGKPLMDKGIIDRYMAAAKDFEAGKLERGVMGEGPRKMTVFRNAEGLGFICPGM